jgi:hypothetical protein
VVIDEVPSGLGYEANWARGLYQRTCILDGLKNCKNNDIIIVADVDEIPSASAVKSYDITMGIHSFDQKLYYYSCNCQASVNWTKAKILPYSMLSKGSIEAIRSNESYPKLLNGGWHFSYMGGVDAIIRKIESSPHQEFNTPEIKSGIQDKVKNCQDIFNRDIKFNRVAIDETYPQYVRDNADKLKTWIN